MSAPAFVRDLFDAAEDKRKLAEKYGLITIEYVRSGDHSTAYSAARQSARYGAASWELANTAKRLMGRPDLLPEWDRDE